MTIDYKSKWEACRQMIRDNISKEQYDTIFTFVEFARFEEGKLVLYVPSRFVIEVIEARYQDLMYKVLKRHFGNISLSYRILQDKLSGATIEEESEPKATIPMPQQQRPANVSPNRLAASDPSELNPQLNTSYNFDTYIEGESNRLARSVGEAIAKNPAKTFNPLFIFGPSGCGKSHLVNAIGLKIRELHPNLRVLYVSAHLFMVQWTDAVRKNVRNDFIAFYQSIDVLIIDDVQEFSGKKDTQNTFFHIFNHLHLNRKQIILTADRPPIDILGLEDRLLTRFKWGLQAEIEKPTQELRRSILEAKVRRNGLSISAELLTYISENVGNSVRDLEGFINSLLAYSVVDNCEIDLQLVKRVMPQFKGVASASRKVTFEDVRDAVCKHFNISVELLESKTRKQPVSYIRQLTVYLTSELTDESTVQIGLKLGNRNHATMIHAIKQIGRLKAVDSQTRKDIELLKGMIASTEI